ncbi:F-box-like domain superfamily [Arabidopsis suecica]|uniref:F-box domain-containing protein n=2 Tax=Arabidopsis TaxID=3701 RepID=A0A5S9Y6A7_ARATH|nr:F-box-like domain superfamily [Arabidopsis suecica]CAA0404183.1 unnamed protein product [Arabidopsis thaliana]
MSNQGAIRRSGEDRISSLPDHLLSQILSNLPTENAVTTSILSTRWKDLWLSTPVLDIDIDAFDDATTFISFATRFLDFSKDSCLHKLQISFQMEDVDMWTIIPWIEDAVKRRIQHLEVDSRIDHMIDTLPLTVYLSESLVSLRLHLVMLHRFVFVSLPNLKVVHLEENLYSYADTMENFISSCPVLEDLTVVRNVDEATEKVLRVRSQSLNSLKLIIDSSKCWYNDDSDDWKVIIDAPRLAYLSLKDDQSVSFVINNLCSSAKADIKVSFNVSDIWDLEESFERSNVGKLLTGLSSVRDMTISGTTLKIICHYLKHEPMPQFRNMTRLHAKFYVCDLEMLPCVLESCPNLKSLVLKLKGEMENEEISLSSSVPKCLQSSLENVEIIRPNYGSGEEMKLSKYFLENSVVLKKFKLCRDCHSEEQESLVVRELMTFQRCSSACEINVVRFQR